MFLTTGEKLITFQILIMINYSNTKKEKSQVKSIFFQKRVIKRVILKKECKTKNIIYLKATILIKIYY